MLLDPRQPLWLPRGSVRAILALLVTGTAIALALAGAAPDWFVGLAGTVVAFYFRDRARPES